MNRQLDFMEKAGIEIIEPTPEEWFDIRSTAGSEEKWFHQRKLWGLEIEKSEEELQTEEPVDESLLQPVVFEDIDFSDFNCFGLSYQPKTTLNDIDKELEFVSKIIEERVENIRERTNDHRFVPKIGFKQLKITDEEESEYEVIRLFDQIKTLYIMDRVGRKKQIKAKIMRSFLESLFTVTVHDALDKVLSEHTLTIPIAEGESIDYYDTYQLPDAQDFVAKVVELRGHRWAIRKAERPDLLRFMN